MSDYKPNPGDEVLLTVGATVDEDGDYRVMIPDAGPPPTEGKPR